MFWWFVLSKFPLKLKLILTKGLRMLRKLLFFRRLKMTLKIILKLPEWFYFVVSSLHISKLFPTIGERRREESEGFSSKVCPFFCIILNVLFVLFLLLEYSGKLQQLSDILIALLLILIWMELSIARRIIISSFYYQLWLFTDRL